jgi:hypothetical protein
LFLILARELRPPEPTLDADARVVEVVFDLAHKNVAAAQA